MPTDNYTENQLGNQIENPDQDLEDIADRILELDVMDNYDTEFADFFFQIQQDGAGGGVPEGAIIMWSGDPNDGIPDGWALCDGFNGTPDLRGEFIVGADADGDRYAVGDQGGSEQVTLSESEMPSHSHSANGNSGSSGDHSHNVSGNTSITGDHSHNVSGNTNNTGSHSHNISGNTSNTGSHWHNISGTTSNTGSHSHSISTAHFDTIVETGSGAYAPTSKNSTSTNNDGDHSHNLSGNTSYDGDHSHNVSGYTSNTGDHTHNVSGNTSNTGDHSHNVSGNTSTDGEHSHNISVSVGSTGGGNEHENRPPYYALAYIMKVS